MGTRTIVTFHPDVECDVCGRRLLRGEQSDVFLTGGQRRMVCELCTTRAAHEGWLRESEGHSTASRASRPQRGLSLFGRLRQSRAGRADDALESPLSGSARSGATRPGSTRGGLYDFLDPASPELGEQGEDPATQDGLAYGGLEHSAASVALDPGRGTDGAPAQDAGQHAVAATGRARAIAATPTTGELKVARALSVFNTSEQPRRVAGVARSLGAPGVRAAPVADAGSVVAIVVAWELCWYRYEVDLGDEAAGVRLTGQGMELDELEAEERLANAAADEQGALSLLDA
jgi:hypothetical protein